MRHDLHALALVLEIALVLDDLLVDAAGGHVVRAGEVDVQEALVVAHVLVGLVAVIQYEALAVLGRVHGSRVDVDVRVDLYRGRFQPAVLHDLSDRAGSDALSDAGNDSSYHEHVFRILYLLFFLVEHMQVWLVDRW